MFAINFNSVGLAIGAKGSADVRAFVPVESKPLQVGNQLIFKARLAAFDIGIFYAKNHGAAMMTGEEPVKQRGAGVADVEMSGGRRGESHANLGVGSHELMVTGSGRVPRAVRARQILPVRFHKHRGAVRQYLGDALHDFCGVVTRADHRISAEVGCVLQHQVESLGTSPLA